MKENKTALGLCERAGLGRGGGRVKEGPCFVQGPKQLEGGPAWVRGE